LRNFPNKYEYIILKLVKATISRGVREEGEKWRDDSYTRCWGFTVNYKN
jgi:hypothetical protein